MDVKQALNALLPGVPVLEVKPAAPPVTAYVVVTDLTDSDGRRYFPEENGENRQERTATLLVTLYGQEGWMLTQLRPLHSALMKLGNRVTLHPGLPVFRSTRLGPTVPPQPAGEDRRPWSAVRIIGKYVL